MGIWESILLLDTTSVIAFVEEAKRPDLLQELAQRASGLEIPDTVLRELTDSRVQRQIISYDEIDFFEVAALESYAALFDRFPQLGSGELGVIARAVTLNRLPRPCTCVLDDARARSVAEQLGLHVVGTIGVLLELEAAGGIDWGEHLEILAALKAEGFRYSWQDHPLSP